MSTQDTAGTAREGTTMDEAKMVSAEEAQMLLDASPDIADAVEAGCDILDNALTSGRQRVEVRRAMDLLRDVERLARSVIALRAEHDDLAAILETRNAEHAMVLERVAELEAIIAGRTTPPTDAEIYAHDARGGAWLVTLPPRAQVRMMPETRYTSDPAEVSRLWWSEGAWWVPVLHGRPRAWPTAEVSRG